GLSTGTGHPTSWSSPSCYLLSAIRTAPSQDDGWIDEDVSADMRRNLRECGRIIPRRSPFLYWGILQKCAMVALIYPLSWLVPDDTTGVLTVHPSSLVFPTTRFKPSLCKCTLSC